ncbi:MAG: alpha/beta hydrolase [Myxococcales bacterium]|nr:alpha/beta hydrolase [Myxococcales bacterium]
MIRATAVLSVLLLSMIAFGPRAQVDLNAPSATLSPLPPTWQGIEEALAHRERTRAHPMQDTEARIVWAETPYQTTEWSVVYVHGFSASRQETAPFAEEVAEALGANRFEARLSGHGQSGVELGQTTAEDWIRDTREAIQIGRKLGERTLIIGVSTGATLVSLIAVHDDLIRSSDALAFISPNFGPKDSSANLLLWPWATTWIPWVIGDTRSWDPQNHEHGKYWTTSYPVAALFPMMAVVRAAEDSLVERIKTPVHMFVSPLDGTVDPQRTRAIYERMVASQKRAWTEVEGTGDHHVLAGRILSAERTTPLRDKLLTWIRKLSS